jgi:PhoH-like ATPase
MKENPSGEPMSVKKTYVLDTNVLMSDPNAIFSFVEHDVIIPMVVLEELDRHKSRPDEVGRNVRQVTRSLDNLRERGSLLDGVSLKEGGTLRVGKMDVVKNVSLEGLESGKPDNMIIAYTKYISATCKATLVSKDINVRIKCDSLGVRCEDYLKMRVADDPQKFFRGVEVIEVPEETIDSFYHEGKS